MKYSACILVLLALLVGCTKRDTQFDSVQEENPRVRYANYVDKVNAYKLFIPPGVWRVVKSKGANLALVNRECVGKVTINAEWLLSDQLVEEARSIISSSFDGDFTWLDDRTDFVVDDCPAVILAGDGRILYSKPEKFYVQRTVAVGIIKFGARQCQFKYVAPNDCYAETLDDLIALMRGFKRLKRKAWGGGVEAEE